ncbi:prepilin-type N-terminal cleavage/methylation domain-containing protein [Photobacterium carnosum]|uniref:type IV pilin protein n=1 Tax=Photobacterium carnosum TaxID=2023717 RepID=UPI001E4830A2|nr:type IV pilin protein [Photobacterium carnosum]MCD9499365.1 prepilin-type N-terminal cleavage/methylation domain-containing protein [Photobacterium carnosum]MCD9549222.1 prepilin-type N-terminal cleavage/methylation domain-containing protein [Photobacterium carnosum]MCF2306161.1 prepilin-type N-terminal cleavage/methylation domain-containing protein [Photobacterium carnosum]
MIKQKGVTLIEMLIVVAVIGVLTAIAYPSYQSHVLKGHRTQAMGDLIKIQLALEESYTQDSAYDFTIVSGSSCSFCDTDSERYTLAVTQQDPGYLITAKMESLQKNDECEDLSLDQTSKGLPERCW